VVLTTLLENTGNFQAKFFGKFRRSNSDLPENSRWKIAGNCRL